MFTQKITPVLTSMGAIPVDMLCYKTSEISVEVQPFPGLPVMSIHHNIPPQDSLRTPDYNRFSVTPYLEAFLELSAILSAGD